MSTPEPPPKSLVLEYGDPKKNISVELTLRLGSQKPRAALASFPLDQEHKQESACIKVECKAQTVKSSDRNEGVGQLLGYMAACVNSKCGMWTNGLERFCYRKVEKDGQLSYDEIPDIPGFGKTEEEAKRPKFNQLKPATSDALLFAFLRCHNYTAGNQGRQKPEAFWERLKLIFSKIYDERNSHGIQFYAASAERHGMNGQLKVKARPDRLFGAVKKDFPNIG